jgi:sporulation protein YlmC with PRC-barrel domain
MQQLYSVALAFLVLTAPALQAATANAAEKDKNTQAEQGQEQRKGQPSGQDQTSEPKNELSKGLPPGTAKATDVIGKELRNSKDESLGKITELLVNPQDGKMQFLVFDATTGLLQSLKGRDHYLIVPWDQVSYKDGTFTTNLERQQLVAVPGFASDAWPTIDQQYREQVQAYFDKVGSQQQAQPASPSAAPSSGSQPARSQAPDATSSSPQVQSQGPSAGSTQQAQSSSPPASSSDQHQAQPSSPTPSSSAGASAAQGQGGASSSAQPRSQAPARPTAQGKHSKDAVVVGDVIRVSKFVGKEVRNQQNDPLGKIDDVVVNLNSGEVSYVVLGSGGILGVGEKLFALPLQAFTPPQGGDQIVLAADKDQIAKAPGFDKNSWPTTANPYWSKKSGS